MTTTLRNPSESDHRATLGVLDAWFEDRGVRRLLPRMWFRHFGATSWLAEADGRLIGFVVGFVSPDRPDEAVVHLLGVDPGFRRRGVGRALVRRFCEEARARGARIATATVAPGDRAAIGFLRAVGFEVAAGPDTERIWGVPAYADYDGERDDRTVLIRAID